MVKTPAEVLRKTKATDKKEDKDDKKSEDDKKGNRSNALLAFISKHKKTV